MITLERTIILPRRRRRRRDPVEIAIGLFLGVAALALVLQTARWILS